MSVVTIYTLFFDDIRVVLFKKKWDNIFFSLSFFSMIIFAAEFIISCFAIDNYPMTFFFLLDLLSIITMIPDVGWLWELIVGESQSNSSQATDIAKTTRASKFARVLRVIRIVRMIRIVKLYK
jgi:hypothetical protein